MTQCGGGQLAEQSLVILGKLAQVPKSPMGGNVLHRDAFCGVTQAAKNSDEVIRPEAKAAIVLAKAAGCKSVFLCSEGKPLCIFCTPFSNLLFKALHFGHNYT
jgi:hypothetical protein